MPVTVKAKPLGLEDGGINDGDDSQHPRRLLRLPFCGTLLAYGGEEGVITAKKVGGDFKVIQRYNDMVRAVAVSSNGKRIVVGCDDGSTMVYTFDDYLGGTKLHPFCHALESNKKDDDDLLSQDFALSSGLKSFPGPQCELPIRDLQFVKEDQHVFWVAIASESDLVLVNVTSSSTLLERELEHQVKEHHSHSGIRGVAVSEPIMATLAMDGRLCLWNTETKALLEREATTCIPKKDVGEIHGADPFDRSCRPVLSRLSPEQLVLATPGCLLPTLRLLRTHADSNKLELMEIENTKPAEGHLEPIVCIHFLNDGVNHADSFFLTSGRDSRLILWQWHADRTKVSPLETFILPGPATDLILQESQAFVACANGTYSIIDLSPHLPSLVAKKSNKPTTKESTNTSGRVKASKKIVKSKKTGWDSDNDSDVAFPETDEATDNKNRVRFVDDEAAEDDDEGKDEEQIKKSNPALDEGDDEDSVYDHIPVQKTLDDTNGAIADLDDDIINLRYTSLGARGAQSVPPQPAFSPASTPLDLARRFLCWNHIGAITLLQGDDRNTVDITFTDSAYKRPVSFSDNMNFILGTIGEDGAIFATDLQMDDDEENGASDGLDDLNMSESTKRAVRQSQNKGKNKATGSSIFFYRFETIGSLREKDWYLTLPVGERVWGAATGTGWAAVATSRKFLRFFSAGGNQGQIIWLKGDPVTMAGRGRFLAVFYHDTAPLDDGTQQLAYMLWDACNNEVLSEGPVCCLGKAASLTWVGFSNDYSLMSMDSDGMLSMLVQVGAAKWEWAPVLDTIGLRKSIDDQFWPITVFDGKMVCVPLKGGNAFPDAARKPVTSTLGLRLPLAASAGNKT